MPLNAFSEFEKLASKLQRNNVRYALVGGVALSFYNNVRATVDIDLLIKESSLNDTGIALAVEGYNEYATPWTFQNDDLTLHRFVKMPGDGDMMIVDSGSPRHDAIVDDARQAPDVNGTIVRVAQKEDLIWLKEKRNSKLDQADVEKLREAP